MRSSRAHPRSPPASPPTTPKLNPAKKNGTAREILSPCNPVLRGRPRARLHRDRATPSLIPAPRKLNRSTGSARPMQCLCRLIDHFVVHRAAEKRMWMANNGRASGVRSGVVHSVASIRPACPSRKKLRWNTSAIPLVCECNGGFCAPQRRINLETLFPLCFCRRISLRQSLGDGSFGKR